MQLPSTRLDELNVINLHKIKIKDKLNSILIKLSRLIKNQTTV